MGKRGSEDLLEELQDCRKIISLSRLSVNNRNKNHQKIDILGFRKNIFLSEIENYEKVWLGGLQLRS